MDKERKVSRADEGIVDGEREGGGTEEGMEESRQKSASRSQIWALKRVQVRRARKLQTIFLTL